MIHLKNHRNFFSTSVFTCETTMISKFSNFFYHNNIYLQITFFECGNFDLQFWFWLAYDFHFLLVNSSILFFSKLITSILCFCKDSPNYTEFTPVYTMLIFYIIKCPYIRNWKTGWNIFSYFCCRQLLRIVSESIYYFKQDQINNSWYLIRFSVLIKL